MLCAERSLRAAAVALMIVAVAASVGCGRRAPTQSSLPTAPAPVPAAQPVPAQAPNTAPAPSDAGDPSFLPSLQQVAQSRVHYKFVLDETSREYHWWNCTIATGKGNAVTPTTLSREQIAAAGYRPCPQCHPERDATPAPPAEPKSREPVRLGPPPAKELEAPIEVGTPPKPEEQAPAKAAPRPASGEFPKATTAPTRPPTSPVRTAEPAKAPGSPTKGQVPATPGSK
jgi:hypothetical protein